MSRKILECSKNSFHKKKTDELIKGFFIINSLILLEEVSIGVHDGEKVVVVGTNGTGKTSMLREIRKSEYSTVLFLKRLFLYFLSALCADYEGEKDHCKKLTFMIT